MKKVAILTAILLIAGCSNMRPSGTGNYGYSSSGASGTGTYASTGGFRPNSNSSTFADNYYDSGRALSQSHTILYAEDPYATFGYR